ncbi:MAG: hypothetical protein H7Y13_05520 [Sphingobacteriaceae bacterium]|nr:hypothetical protein [Sphingobacteriaceae bacterium]
MRNIIILCTILLVAIAALATKYFTALAGRDNNITKVLNFIPADAALVLHFNNDESFYEIFKDYKLFKEILGQSRSSELDHLKSLVTHTKLAEVTFDKRVFVSLHAGKDSVELLYCMNLDKDYSNEEISKSLSDIPNFRIDKGPKNTYTIHSDLLHKPAYLFLEQGIALLSFSEDLIKKCINREEAHLNKAATEAINKASAQNLNSPVNLFVNQRVLEPFLMHFMTDKSDGNIGLLKQLKGYTSLSMNFKSDALMLNGISTVDSLNPNYLTVFLHQKSVPNTIKKILPENTATFLAFGLSDINRFHDDLKSYFDRRGELRKLKNQLTTIESSTGVNPDRDIKPLLGKEFVCVENSYGEQFALISTSNGRNINFKLQLISRPVNEVISQVNYSHLFYYYFGDPLKKFPRPYYAIADNYIIIANTPGIITNFLSGYENERFLSNTDDFKRYDQLVAHQSNILYFINIKKTARLARTHLKKEYLNRFSEKNIELKKFYGLSYQWTSEGDHFFSNFYLSHNSGDSISLNK